jgi:hypothetical protein
MNRPRKKSGKQFHLQHPPQYLGINLTREVRDCYNENYKISRNEIEDDTRRWKDFPCSWISGIKIVKMALLLKTIYRFSAMSHQNPSVTLFRNRKINLM